MLCCHISSEFSSQNTSILMHVSWKVYFYIIYMYLCTQNGSYSLQYSLLSYQKHTVPGKTPFTITFQFNFQLYFISGSFPGHSPHSPVIPLIPRPFPSFPGHSPHSPHSVPPFPVPCFKDGDQYCMCVKTGTCLEGLIRSRNEWTKRGMPGENMFW